MKIENLRILWVRIYYDDDELRFNLFFVIMIAVTSAATKSEGKGKAKSEEPGHSGEPDALLDSYSGIDMSESELDLIENSSIIFHTSIDSAVSIL